MEKFNRFAEYCLRLIYTKENKTQKFVKRIRVELQRALGPLRPMGFAVALEAATQTEMENQTVMQMNIATSLATTPYTHPCQGPWKP